MSESNFTPQLSLTPQAPVPESPAVETQSIQQTAAPQAEPAPRLIQ
jgi:hypothetical protein